MNHFAANCKLKPTKTAKLRNEKKFSQDKPKIISKQMQTIILQTDYKSFLWIICYNNNCLIHLSKKEKAEWYFQEKIWSKESKIWTKITESKWEKKLISVETEFILSFLPSLISLNYDSHWNTVIKVREAVEIIFLQISIIFSLLYKWCMKKKH